MLTGVFPVAATSPRSPAPDTGAAAPQPLPHQAGEARVSPAFFTSPVIRVDAETQKVILQFREPDTGAVTAQYPSERQLAAYRRHGLETEKRADASAPAAPPPAAEPMVEASAAGPDSGGSPAAAPDGPTVAPPPGPSPARHEEPA